MIEEKAAFLKITPNRFKQFAERGYQIALGNDLETRREKFGGEDIQEDKLREILLPCLYGGVIEKFTANLN